MKKIISAANNLVLLQKEGKDDQAKSSFSLLKEKDKKAIKNTIEILHDKTFCTILN